MSERLPKPKLPEGVARILAAYPEEK